MVKSHWRLLPGPSFRVKNAWQNSNKPFLCRQQYLYYSYLSQIKCRRENSMTELHCCSLPSLPPPLHPPLEKKVLNACMFMWTCHVIRTGWLPEKEYLYIVRHSFYVIDTWYLSKIILPNFGHFKDWFSCVASLKSWERLPCEALLKMSD